MTFKVIEAHASAIIECECGEFLALSDDRAETCESCPYRYHLTAQVDIFREAEPKETQEWELKRS